MNEAPPKTVPLVPLTDLTDLARKGQAMRKAQRRYFDARKMGAAEKSLRDLLRWSFHAEAEFDKAVAAALAREKQSLPGLDEDLDR